MRRTKKKSLQHAAPTSTGLGSAVAAAATWDSLRQRIAPHHTKSSEKLKDRDLVFILRNLASLTESGVSLPKALGTLADEKPLERHREMLRSIRRDLENGETFSAALGKYPASFDVIMVNQIKVGEHSGTLPDTLANVARHCEQAHQLRGEVIRKLAYPTLLVVMGSAVIAFLLMYVIPVFQETYDNAHVPLPLVTKLLIAVGDVAQHYGWILLLVLATGVLAVGQLRKQPNLALKMDKSVLRWPVVGGWLRDMAVLQLMEVLGGLRAAGYTLAEALGESAHAVGNRAVKRSVRDLQGAIHRGERFSRAIERYGEMFPPIVSQLVIVGEQTGKLATATNHIRDHLQREIERKTNLFVSTIEPVLTISLAGAIAVILLSIYLPMFDMVNTIK